MSSQDSRVWFTSSFSQDSNSCVEVCFDTNAVLVRDSKYRGPAADQPVLAVSAADWPAFLEGCCRLPG